MKILDFFRMVAKGFSIQKLTMYKERRTTLIVVTVSFHDVDANSYRHVDNWFTSEAGMTKRHSLTWIKEADGTNVESFIKQVLNFCATESSIAELTVFSGKILDFYG